MKKLFDFSGELLKRLAIVMSVLRWQPSYETQCPAIAVSPARLLPMVSRSK
jgi:hypothetical protein